jgi:hypothetical protein
MHIHLLFVKGVYIMMHDSTVINPRPNLAISSSSSELSQDTANGVAFGRNVCSNSNSNSSATVQSPFVLNTSNFQQTNTKTSDTTSIEDVSDNYLESPEMEEMIRKTIKDQLQNTLAGQNFTRIKSLNLRKEDDIHQEAIDQVKSSCDDVIANKNNEISNRQLHRRIAKGISIVAAIIAIATVLFIILTQPTMLIFIASMIILTVAIKSCLVSVLYNIAVSSDTDKDNCHAFIARMLQDMEFKNLEDKQPKALNTLNNIITYYLNGSTPIKLEPFTKLSSLNRTDIDKQAQNKNAQENTRKVLANFIEVLETSADANHRAAKNITPEFIQALKEDIATYTETLTANYVMDLANLPLRKSAEKLQLNGEVPTHS